MDISILEHLGERRDKIAASTILDKRVPRWDNPQIWLRFKPVDHTEVRDRLAKATKAKGSLRGLAEVNAQADVLISACIGVYAVLPDLPEQEWSLRPGDPEGSLTTFDADLARALKIPNPEDATAREICKFVFLTEPDLMSMANEVTKWSGYKMQNLTADALEGDEGE